MEIDALASARRQLFLDVASLAPTGLRGFDLPPL